MAKHKKAANFLVYGLMALLIAGLGGFGITNFGGAATAVATVGDEEVSAEEYYRAMVTALNAQQAAGVSDLSLAAMQAQGIPMQVRNQLITGAAQDGEARRIGLSVGDARVARTVTSMEGFQGVTGEFDREAYEFALERNGWTVADFEDSVREETTRSILRAAAMAGIPPSEANLSLLIDWFGERRSLSWVRIDDSSLAEPVPAPTDAELAEFLAGNEDAFTLPEMKRITYAVLTPEMLAAEMPADEAALRALYAERMDRYVVPERRLVERLVFGSAEEAAAARAKLDAGEADFAALVAERDLTLEDVDMGDVTESDLGQAGAAVFALEEPGIVGPYPSDLGPALFRMNAILSASETTFEDARAELQAELAAEEAVEALVNRASEFDDRLAEGATLEDLAAETEMELATVDFWVGTDDSIALDPEFRTVAEVLTDKDFPEILILESGALVAMRLDETLPPRVQALDEVRDEVADAWTLDRRMAQVTEAAEAALAEIEAGGSLEALDRPIETVELATRIALNEAGRGEIAATAFEAAEGATVLVRQPDAILLVRVDAIAPPDPEDQMVNQFRQALFRELTLGLTNDVYLYYLQALTNEAGVSFNDSVTNGVHTQIFR